jgi:methionine-rich copper-binding protein CopC
MQKRIFTRSARIGAVIGLSTFASLSGLMSSQADANSVVATVPAVGAVLSQAPNAVLVTAASSLLPDGDSLSVTDPSGAQVDDGSLTISDTSAVVGLKPLTVTGIYTVSYTLLSATDAPLTGSYTFLFNAPATVTSPSAAPTPSVSPAKGASNSSANVAVLVFLGLATIVALFLLWYARMIWKQYRKGRKRAARERSPK